VPNHDGGRRAQEREVPDAGSQPTRAPSSDGGDACNARPQRTPLGSADVDGIVSRVDRVQFERAMVACRDLVIPGLKPVQVNLLRVGSFVEDSRPNVPIGYGLEQTVRDQCLTDEAPLRTHFATVGICAQQEMAGVVLASMRMHLLSKESGPVNALKSHLRSPEWVRWSGLLGDELPSGTMLDRHGQGVPSEYSSAMDLLEYLASRNTYLGVYLESRTGEYDPSKIVSHLSPKGVRIKDVNGPSEEHFTRDRIVQQLLGRRGRAFSMLSWVGYRYASRGPQHSQLAIGADGENLIVKLDGTQGLRLTFVLQDSGYQLTQIEQMVEADL